MELNSQNAVENAVGFAATYSWHVSALAEHPVEVQELVEPAQSPQKVVSTMMFMLEKYVSISHPLSPLKATTGRPQLVVSGAPDVTSAGTSLCVQNQTYLVYARASCQSSFSTHSRTPRVKKSQVRHLQSRRLPLHCIDASAVVVEGVTIGLAHCGGNRTARTPAVSTTV